MFKMKKKDTFNWPVVINEPRDGGGFLSHEIKCEFKLQEQSKMDTLLAQFREDDRDILKVLLVGWTGVQNEDGEPMPFNDETRDAFLDLTYVRTALLKAYFDATSGNKVRKGN